MEMENAAEVMDQATAEISQAVEHLSRLDQYLDELLPKLLNFGIQVLLALLTFFIGQRIIRLIRKLIRRSLSRLPLVWPPPSSLLSRLPLAFLPPRLP